MNTLQPFYHRKGCLQCAVSRAIRREGWLRIAVITLLLLIGFAYAGSR